MGRRQGSTWDAASARLARLAQQWRPVPAGEAATVRPADAGGFAPAPEDPWQGIASGDQTGSSAVRLGPWNRASVRALAVVVAGALAVAGWWMWSGRPREIVVAPEVLATGAPITAAASSGVAAPTSARSSVVVHVVGQVHHPGVVTLPVGSRVADAVTAAGGVTKKGADDSVNLARLLVDGEQVIVGFSAQAVAGALGISSSPAAASLLNLNSADAAGFETLPGVGPVLAERIVQWRTANGPFRSVDELSEVSGIGDSIMGQIRPRVTV